MKRTCMLAFSKHCIHAFSKHCRPAFSKLFLCAFALCAFAGMCVGTFTVARAQTFNALLAKDLQDTLDSYVNSIPNIKGMSASVYLPGRGVWTGTHGVSYGGTPIAGNMLFGIASNTKVFVAATILKLVENGDLSLDDPLRKWIGAYTNINPNITIRQLLNHTSGISDPLFVAPYVDTIRNNPTRVFTPDEVLRWVGAPTFAPGNGWGYSNINYVIAGLIAEKATGRHISALIREYILVPLELNNTFFDVKEPSPGTIAHRWFNGVDFHDTSRVGLNTAGASAGAIFSTSSDMVRWYHALLSGSLLDSASFAELTTFVTTSGAYTYGLGIERQPFFAHMTWGHGGSTWGYRSRMVYDPATGAAVAGLTNSWPSGVDGVTLLLYKVLLDRLPSSANAITGVISVCAGQRDVTFTTTPIAGATSYEWILPQGAHGASTTTSITVQFSGNAVTGTVSVRGVNAYGEGVGSTKVVTVLNKPPTPTISRRGDTLISSSAVGNQWYNANGKIVGATAQTHVFTAGQVYYVIVTNPCVSDTSTHFILPAAAAAITGVVEVCQGDSVVTFTTTPIAGAIEYKWTLPAGADGASTTTSITVQFTASAVSGNVTVRGVNQYGEGVVSTTAVTVHNKPPMPTITRRADTLVSSVSTGNQWYSNGEKLLGATNQNYLPTGPGVYYVVVSDTYCGTDTSENIVIDDVPSDVADATTNAPATPRLYPNPITDELVISVDGRSSVSDERGATITIVNALGQIVYNGAYTDNTRVRTTDFAPGVYVVLFEYKETIVYRAVVK